MQWHIQQQLIPSLENILLWRACLSNKKCFIFCWAPKLFIVFQTSVGKIWTSSDGSINGTSCDASRMVASSMGYKGFHSDWCHRQWICSYFSFVCFIKSCKIKKFLKRTGRYLFSFLKAFTAFYSLRKRNPILVAPLQQADNCSQIAVVSSSHS